MMTFDQLVAKLRSRHPKIGETEAMVTIATAYRDLASEYRWKFLLGETHIQTEASVAYGTVAIAAAGTLVTLTPGSGAEVWSAGWKNRRIVISSRSEPYKIASFGSTTTASVLAATPWAGDAQTAAAYTMYRSEYGAPIDCDYGSEMTLWDVQNNLPLTIVSAGDIKTREAVEPGRIGYPEMVARVQIEQDGSGNPIEMLQFFPAPPAVYSFPFFYFKKQAAPAGSGRPLWPENYEDLIWRRAELELEENPRHRIVISEMARQKYYSRLWDLKKINDGGAEIDRRLQLARSVGWSTYFRNVNFTSTGINPLVGG